MSIHSQEEASSDKLDLCPFARQVRLLAYMQVAVLVGFPGAVAMKIEYYGQVAESQCFMTAGGLKDNPPGNPFYVYF